MVVKEEKITTEGGITVNIRINDKYCKNRTKEETQEILKNIARIHADSMRRINAGKVG